MRRPQALIRRLREDESGVVGPAVAVLSISLLAAAGLALDVGLYYMNNRDLRSATEAAALSAAVVPTQAQARATEYLVKNGYDASVLKSVEVGYYCANIDPRFPAGSRFVTSADLTDCPGSSVQNAVRVTTGKESRRFLTGIMGGASPIPELSATASAARIDEAGIAISSDLIDVTKITGTLVQAVNGILGRLLNITLNLNKADVDALMRGTVDAGKFFDSLAVITGQSGTYKELVDGTAVGGSYGMKDIAFAAANATDDAATQTVLKTVGTAAGNGYRVPLKDLFGLGVWRTTLVDLDNGSGKGARPPALRAGLNAYQLLSFAAQTGPGVIDLSRVVNLVAPGGTGNTVRISGVATGPSNRPRFSFGPAGETTAGASILRLQLDVNLVNLTAPTILDAKASVPLVVDVQASEGSLKSINCSEKSSQETDTLVTVHAKSGLANIYLGRLAKANAMTKPVPPISFSDFQRTDLVSLRLLGLGLASVKGRAAIQPVTGAERDTYFGPGLEGRLGNRTSAGTPVVVGSTVQVGPTVRNLKDGLLAPGNLQVVLLDLVQLDVGYALAPVTEIVTGLGGVLGNVADPLLDNVLAALGIQLGRTTVWATGARCGVPVLI